MKRTKTALIALLAAAAAATPVLAMPGASEWQIGPVIGGRNYSVGMPAQPAPVRGGGWSIEFPQAGRGQVDALTTATGPLAGAHRITIRYRIDAAPGTSFVADEMPSEPATVSLYFQQRGDNWSAKGRYASYRWYAPARAVIPLTPGEHTVTVGLDETWTNIWGRPNTEERQAFSAALADTARIGLAFGSPTLRSHGVYATGPARFTLLGFDIE